MDFRPNDNAGTEKMEPSLLCLLKSGMLRARENTVCRLFMSFTGEGKTNTVGQQ